MLVKFQTIKPANPSDNPVEIAGMYLVSDFVFDFAATIPTIIARSNNKVFMLRLIHISEVSKSNYPL